MYVVLSAMISFFIMSGSFASFGITLCELKYEDISLLASFGAIFRGCFRQLRICLILSIFGISISTLLILFYYL